MHPSFVFSEDTFSVVSGDIKLNEWHSSITCLTVFFTWAFSVLVSFYTIPCCSFWRQTHLGQSKSLLVSWNFVKISEMHLLEILSSLAIARWLIMLVIFTLFVFILLEVFAKILDVRIFTISKEKIGAVVEKYLHVGGRIFFCFKTLYLDWFMWDNQKFLHNHFWG